MMNPQHPIDLLQEEVITAHKPIVVLKYRTQRGGM